jgi:trehalose-6-phosphate synthase
MIQSFRKGYQWVNHEYAKTINADLDGYQPSWLIVNDFHFSLLPRTLTRLRPHLPVVFFLHVPWPPANLFCVSLPPFARRRILKGMACNVIGFQTPMDLRRFESTFGITCERATNRPRGYQRPDTRPSLVSAAVPVDTLNIRRVALEADALRFMRRVRLTVGARQLIMRAERLDPIKGTIEGLEAFWLLLEQHPEIARNTRMLVVGEPSRLHLPEHSAYFGLVQHLVASINRSYTPRVEWNGLITTEPDRRLLFGNEWPAVVLLAANNLRHEVLGAMCAADVGLFNSLADGMNLSIKEFVVCNQPRFLLDVNEALTAAHGLNAPRVVPGLAVASTRQGAYNELVGSVLAVANPVSVRETASVLADALELVRRSQAEVIRMATLAAAAVEAYNPAAWLCGLRPDAATEATGPHSSSFHREMRADTHRKTLPLIAGRSRRSREGKCPIE